MFYKKCLCTIVLFISFINVMVNRKWCHCQNNQYNSNKQQDCSTIIDLVIVIEEQLTNVVQNEKIEDGGTKLWWNKHLFFNTKSRSILIAIKSNRRKTYVIHLQKKLIQKTSSTIFIYFFIQEILSTILFHLSL